MPVEITPELVIAGRDLTEPKLDPTGRRLAVVARSGGAAAISIVDLAEHRSFERQLSTWPPPQPGRGSFGGCYDWLPDGSAIVYAATDGALWMQPVPGGGPTRLTDHDRPAGAPALAPDGSFVVYALDQAEVWLQPLDGGPARRLDDGGHDFCADPSVDPSSALVAYQAWSVPDMPWDGAEVVTVEVTDPTARTSWRPSDGAVQQPRFAPDGTPLRVHDGGGWLQLHLGERPVDVERHVEHAEASWGQGQVSYAVSADGSRIAFTRNERGFGRLCVADVDTGEVAEVARGVHAQLSWRGDRLAALRSGARTPTQVVVHDVQTWQRHVVAVGPVAGWDAVELVEPEALTIDHDGATLHARRYVPAGGPTGRLLVSLHGGPESQWPVSFQPRVAAWVDRGWDVLLPDHRGSTGHGRTYQQALHGRWGDLDVEDTAAWIDHAHRAGWATPATTVVTGGSSGGYTVLRLLGLRPGLVAAGVALYPVTDLLELAVRSHRFEAHSTITLVGPLDDVERYRARSAGTVVESIREPLLVLHGTDDPVVPVDGTVAFVDALRDAGGDVELHLFDGEGHGFRHPPNQLAEQRLVAAFVERVVGQLPSRPRR